jgi:hypothetical protein
VRSSACTFTDDFLTAYFEAEEREREKRKWVGVRETTFNTGETAKFTAMKVPGQFPLVILVKVGCR